MQREVVTPGSFVEVQTLAKVVEVHIDETGRVHYTVIPSGTPNIEWEAVEDHLIEIPDTEVRSAR